METESALSQAVVEGPEVKLLREGAAPVPVLPIRDDVYFPGVVHSLLVGREQSLNAVSLAVSGSRHLVTVAQRESGIDQPEASDLFEVGTLSEVLHIFPLPDGPTRVVLRGLARVRCHQWIFLDGAMAVEAELCDIEPMGGATIEALKRECMAAFVQAVELGMQAEPDIPDELMKLTDAADVTNFVAHYTTVVSGWKQSILEEDSVGERLESLIERLTAEVTVLSLQQNLRSKVEKELGATQREFYLREQLRIIQAELGEGEKVDDEGEQYRAKLYACQLSEKTLEHSLQEVRRLERAHDSSPEGMVIRTYLDWLCALPWQKSSLDSLNVKRAALVLSRDHFGLDKVKDRILDFLAVRQLAPGIRGPILCFVGPPGVGKTSIGRSIAESMGRAFHRISLGGIRDEAEIRGHRRTYIGSMPGRIIQGLKVVGTNNPVFLLDEIDKMGLDHRGDPTSALLEALDPEQNSGFTDHYVEVPFDLSKVMFIATANAIEDIPPALRDRLEIIRFPSYTEDEKLHIAEKYLLPRKVAEHGLRKEQLRVSNNLLQTVIRDYTREAGVRSLSRELSTLCRKAARRIAEKGDHNIRLNGSILEDWLGKTKFRSNSKWDRNEVGAATGLVYSEYGGDILTIEVCLTPAHGDQPTVRLTGSLGEVMKESALAAMTYLRANQAKYGGETLRHDLHLHVPEGAVPKDGPSAGVTILAALVSAYTNREVRRDVAMTGEITLRGKVLPVGGIREKVLAAHRAGIRHVILPEDNECDLDELPAAVREAIVFTLVKTVDEVLSCALV